MAGPIITCACGAKVRVPEGAAASFRCPRCKAAIEIPGQLPPAAPQPAEPAVAAAAALAAAPPPPPVVSAPLYSDRDTICPICQTGILQGEAVQACSGCDQIHHAECWQEIGGCGTFGCSQAPAVDKDQQDVQAPLTAWGDAKKCPACGETIKSIAVRCRYCGTSFDSVDPMSAADLRRQAVSTEELASFKRVVVALFALSIIGCLAPVLVIVGAAYLLPRRDKLAKCGPLFTIMGWITFGLSCIYSVVLLIAFLLEK